MRERPPGGWTSTTCTASPPTSASSPTPAVTGDVEAAAHIKLQRARLNRFFSFGGYGSDSTDHGELTRAVLKRASVVSGGSVTPDQAFVVGDTPHDVASAHAAGIPCAGVASHHDTAEQLRAGGADWVIDSLADGLPL